MTYEEWGGAIETKKPPSGTYADVVEMYADWTADRENLLEGYHACCREGALLADRCDKLADRVRVLEEEKR